MILSPPPLSDLPAGTVLRAGLGTSEVIPDFDFETYSPAGFEWDVTLNKYRPSKKRGLELVGVARYTEHPEAEVLSLAYDLKDGLGKRLWVPSEILPVLPDDLLDHVESGGLLEAWNSSFEHWVWTNICVPKYGFPPIKLTQLRDAAAKARAFALPGSLQKAGEVLDIFKKKDTEGKRLIMKFSIPRNPTKGNPHRRNYLSEEKEDAQKLFQYNLRDIEAEAELSSKIPDLTPDELEFWLCDQAINFRGVQIDIEMVESCLSIIRQAENKYNSEIQILTNYEVSAVTEVQKLKKWLSKFNVHTDSLDEEAVDELLKNQMLSPPVRRALEIRSLMGSSAVKKLHAMKNLRTSKGRVHDLFIYHSARTGRAAGSGFQPQNLPNSGPDTKLCECGRFYSLHLPVCCWCGSKTAKVKEWSREAAEVALETIKPGQLSLVEYYWSNPIKIIYGCIRGLIISAPNKDLICSDYSAIEAVVLAALAGEQWRMEVFRTHGKIYEMSASKITGVPFDEFIRHKKETDQHHPLRKTVGKVAELASGYQGWIGAWKQFGADEFFSDDEMKKAILAWREASPMIVQFWGGQTNRWGNYEYFGLEGSAVQAVMNPGTEFSYRGISYIVNQDVLYCKLLSGRYLTYHKPRLSPSDRRPGTVSLSFEGYNTNPKNGSIGWIRMNTYGGKLTENVVQATARDILAHAIVNLEKANYPIVLHVHDELIAEVPEGFGSVEEFESIMAKLPEWAKNWPVRATGGWRGKRYGK